ncbi:MAG: hypothetical protein EOS58_32405 [Mesorhizobium sp.]|nr:MAG: hypothetical protein EOS58_32405 [Mesorhizobium sp.]
MPKYLIIPENEPQGEGNGWWPCDPTVAQAWSVWTEIENGEDAGREGDLIQMFDTRAAAESHVSSLQQE